MAKFEYRLLEKDKVWTAEITRKVSARKTNVTKCKGDFTSEKQANEWAQAELKALSGKVSERRRNTKIKKEQEAKKEQELKAKLNDEQ